jgi:hypothetical protein
MPALQADSEIQEILDFHHPAARCGSAAGDSREHDDPSDAPLFY